MKITIIDIELDKLGEIFKELAGVKITSLPCEPIPGVEIDKEETKEEICTKSRKKAVR
mgnify:FL=1